MRFSAPPAGDLGTSVQRVRVVRRVVQLIWGDDLDDALRPVLGVTLVSSAAGSATWSFMAIWAIEELDAKAELPFALLAGAVLADAQRLPRRVPVRPVGRRRVILFGQAIMVGYPLVLLSLVDTKWAGLAALVPRGGRSARSAARSRQAMVADLVAPERHQAAYASVRVAANVGVVVGPPLGGLLLILGSWSLLFPSVAVLSGIAWLVAFRYLPQRGAYAPEGPPERGSLAVIVRDRPFLLFLGSAVFAWLVVRRLRDRAPGVDRRRVRVRAAGLGLPRLGQPAPRDAPPGAADARHGAGRARAEARGGAARDGASVPRSSCGRTRSRRSSSWSSCS